MRLPAYSEIPGASFATIETFLAFQRVAVATARRTVEADANAAWQRLPPVARERFRVASEDPGDLEAHWRRAWWIYTIGGRPRAPFEIGTSSEHAERLLAAFAPFAPPRAVPDAFERWWSQLIERCREQLAGYVAGRVAGAARRLAEEGVVTPDAAVALAAAAAGRGEQRQLSEEGARLAEYSQGAAERILRDRRGSRRGKPGRARRVRDAEQRSIALHRSLDERFRELGPVCGACTRETGGCCSLTVPLLWREADFRLLALGETETPRPLPETAGACPFLGLEGCRLPSDRRPHICRSFLCERAEAALSIRLGPVREELQQLSAARSQLG